MSCIEIEGAQEEPYSKSYGLTRQILWSCTAKHPQVSETKASQKSDLHSRSVPRSEDKEGIHLPLNPEVNPH